MNLNNLQENNELTTDNFKIYVPKTLRDYTYLSDSTKENIEFDLEIKIWVKNNK